jgi:hypothetical protein
VSKRQTLGERILELLSSGREVSALEFPAVSLQYCARLAELRKAGAIISNRVEVLSDGTLHGSYRLIQRPPFVQKPSSRSSHSISKPSSASVDDSLFPPAAAYEYPDCKDCPCN